MKIYCAGPMRGIELFNWPSFEAAARHLRNMGHEVITPTEIDEEMGMVAVARTEDGTVTGVQLTDQYSFERVIARDLEAVRSLNDARNLAEGGDNGIVLLPGWEASTGAKMELAAAADDGLRVYRIEGFGLELPPPVYVGPSGVVSEISFGLPETVPDIAGRDIIANPGSQYEQRVPAAVVSEVSFDLPETAPDIAGRELGRHPSVVHIQSPVFVPARGAAGAAKRASLWPNDAFVMPTSFPPDGEVQVIDSKTGGAKGQKLARFDLLPPDALNEIAEHFGRGAAKYADRNWERGYAWGLSYGALQRHANAYWSGEDVDEDTGGYHLAAVGFHALALLAFQLRGIGTDDRGAV